MGQKTFKADEMFFVVGVHDRLISKGRWWQMEMSIGQIAATSGLYSMN